MLWRTWHATIFFLHIAVKGMNLLSCLFPNPNGSFTPKFEQIILILEPQSQTFDAGRQKSVDYPVASGSIKNLFDLFFFLAGENVLIRTEGRNCIARCHTRQCQLMYNRKTNFGDARKSRARLCHVPPQLAMTFPLASLILLGLFLSSATAGLRQHTAFWCQRWQVQLLKKGILHHL
uniref:Secreted protein n=1 Tax=Ixodes ricinus TaxID=34613 RepID=A0A6B0UYQ4_IXORI